MRQQPIKPLLLLVFVLLTPTISTVAQNKDSAAAKEKADKLRAERFKKFAAPMIAEQQQRKAIIRDLINTCAGRLHSAASDSNKLIVQSGAWLTSRKAKSRA